MAKKLPDPRVMGYKCSINDFINVKELDNLGVSIPPPSSPTSTTDSSPIPDNIDKMNRTSSTENINFISNDFDNAQRNLNKKNEKHNSSTSQKLLALSCDQKIKRVQKS